MKELLQKILNLLKDATKVVFMGIGEIKMNDDGVGPYVISELLTLSNEKFLFINAGIDPMTRINDIINFNASHLVLLDTCTLNKPPGTVAILERKNMLEYVPISTHTIPIHIVIDLLIQKLHELKFFMIGFVPENLDEGFTELSLYKQDEYTLDDRDENDDLPFFDFNLTKTVKEAADNIITLIKELTRLS